MALGTNAFPSPAAAAAAAHGAGLRLRADDRAALAGPAGRDRLAPSAGHRRQREPVPLLPADRRQPDPVGRVRRHLPLRAQGPPRLRPAPGDVPHPRRPTSSRPSPSWRGCASPTGGAARSTRARASSRSTARRSPGARPTRSATPGSASGRPGSAPTSCSTCCPASAPSGPSWTPYGASRCPSRRSRWRFAGIQATRWSLQRADRDEGRRNLWLRGLDRAGLGFDS